MNAVKRTKCYTVAMGNPPYSVSSWNSGDWITDLVEVYKRTVRGEESQIQSLSNDYIKFLRFSEWLIQKSTVGVLGLITGHGYLHGTQPRDLRKHLSEIFDACYCLDLHGSIRRTGPDDNEDEPVFQITTGVAIMVAFRSKEKTTAGKTAQGSLTGRLQKKLTCLAANSVADLAGATAMHTPVLPNFYFAPAASGQDIETEYHGLPELPSIFGTGNRQSDKEVYWATGFASQQDELAMSFTREEVEEKMAALAASRTFDELKQTYRICTTDQWDYSEAKIFAGGQSWQKHIAQVAYRPFDRQWTVLHKHVLTILRTQVMSQLSRKDRNLGLISSRAVNDLHFAHCFVTCEPVDKIFISSKTSTNAYVFPLFFKDEDMYGQKRRPNISRRFLDLLTQTLGLRKTGEYGIPKGVTPEDIFHYAYAVFHSPAYRKRYAEFLKIDFPRLPLTGNVELFRALAQLGGQLVALHLLESPHLDDPITEFIPARRSLGEGGGARNPEVEKVSWSNNTVWLDKAQTTGFQGVREDVWNFHIGGYQVCEKWLKDRKGRTLTNDDLSHYQKIVNALSETIALMRMIDDVIEQHGGWPIK